MRRLSLICAGILALVALAMPASASACSCAPIEDVGAAVEESDAAVTARLLSVKRLGGSDEPFADASFRYRIRRVVKGPDAFRRGRVITVRSATSSAACGLPTERGRIYGLLLSRLGGRLTGSICGLVDPKDLRARPDGAAARGGRAPNAGCPSSSG